MSTPDFHDHFSSHAADYARFRPTYPSDLFAYLAGLCDVHDLAWDVGTGSGQAAVALAAHFHRVVATDASAEQIAQATPHPRVTYHTAPAEHSPLADASVDLVAVAQALHWFNFDPFFAEVNRVLRPGGVFAAWTYGVLFTASTEIDAVFAQFLDTVAPYWPPERRYIDAGYQTIPFPFDELAAPSFSMEAVWTLDTLLGYLGTWSAAKRCAAATGADPVEAQREAFIDAWGDPATSQRIRWPLHLRVGRCGPKYLR